MSFGKIEAGFWVILSRGPRLLLGRPYYGPLLWFMMIGCVGKTPFRKSGHMCDQI